MKPRSKTSRKPLKKKQNGKRTTKKNTKKHKQTHQARRKKGRVMLGGENNTSSVNESSVNESNNDTDRKKGSQNKEGKILGHNPDQRVVWNTVTRPERERAEEWDEQEHAQILAEEFHSKPSLDYFKENLKKVRNSHIMMAIGTGLFAFFVIDRN